MILLTPSGSGVLKVSEPVAVRIVITDLEDDLLEQVDRFVVGVKMSSKGIMNLEFDSKQEPPSRS